MYTKEVLVKLIKKARQLHKKGLSQRTIAQKMKVSKDSVGKWVKMQFDDEFNIKDSYKEKRGFKKWGLENITKLWVIESKIFTKR